jgi:hypothetical protein
MTEEAQRVAIAEFCGWLFVQMHGSHGYYYFNLPLEKLDTAKRGMISGATPFYQLPDYTNDLNAIHEAELHCFKTPSERCNYLCHLENVASRTRKVAPDQTIDPVTQWACFAEAAQRAEALLRTIGRWED